MIFRNSSGEFVGAVGHRLNLRLRTGTAELYVIMLGLDFAEENGWCFMLLYKHKYNLLIYEAKLKGTASRYYG